MKLTPTQRLILLTLEHLQPATPAEIAAATGASPHHTATSLRDLTRFDLLIRDGNDRSATYSLPSAQ